MLRVEQRSTSGRADLASDPSALHFALPNYEGATLGVLSPLTSIRQRSQLERERHAYDHRSVNFYY